MELLERFFNWIYAQLDPAPIRLAVVRKYLDANGSYVGELYLEESFAGMRAYKMIGVSLDTLPLAAGDSFPGRVDFALDTANDFLAFMPPLTLRVGAIDPLDNDAVRQRIARLPRRRLVLAVQNRFIEHVLDKGKV